MSEGLNLEYFKLFLVQKYYFLLFLQKWKLLFFDVGVSAVVARDRN